MVNSGNMQIWKNAFRNRLLAWYKITKLL